jgi:hypothetical protein
MKPSFVLKFGVGGVQMSTAGKLEPVTSKTSVPVIAAFRSQLPKEGK